MSNLDGLATFFRARLNEDREHLGHPQRLCPDPDNHIPAPRLVDEDMAKRMTLRLYENALAAKHAGSTSRRNRTQDEAAVDILGAAVQWLALPYSRHPDYMPEWRL